MTNGSIGFRKIKNFLFITLLFTSLACAGHSTSEKAPPTFRSFEGNYERIWQTTLSVVQDQKRLPVKYASMKNGYLASDWVKEERTVHLKDSDVYQRYPSRYRINVSLRRMPVANQPKRTERITVTVSKQMELMEGENWRAFPSDHQTEAAIIAAISKELGQ